MHSHSLQVHLQKEKASLRDELQQVNKQLNDLMESKEKMDLHVLEQEETISNLQKQWSSESVEWSNAKSKLEETSSELKMKVEELSAEVSFTPIPFHALEFFVVLFEALSLRKATWKKNYWSQPKPQLHWRIQMQNCK